MSSRANLSKAFQDTALEAVLRALFSLPESGNREQLRDMVRDYIEGPGRPTLMDGFARSEDTFSFANAKRARFQKYWRAAIDQIISRRKTSPTAPAHRDLLDLLLSVRDTETGEALSDGEIRDQCATMFFAGSETTARLLFWACYLLAMDSEEQTRVREEVTAFRPERIDGPDDLQNWRRLRNVLLEALRLYPPVPQIIRVANGPDEICGEKIVANTQVWISSWVMHRHRRFSGSADCLPARSVCGKNGPVDANAGLYSIWRGTPHLHRPLVCIVGGRDGHGAAAVVLRDQPAGRAARVASRPRNNRAVLRTLISVGLCLSREDEARARSFRRPCFPQAVQQELEPREKRRVVADSCPDGAVARDGVDRIERETRLYCRTRLVKSTKMREGRGQVKMCVGKIWVGLDRPPKPRDRLLVTAWGCSSTCPRNSSRVKAPGSRGLSRRASAI